MVFIRAEYNLDIKPAIFPSTMRDCSCENCTVSNVCCKHETARVRRSIASCCFDVDFEGGSVYLLFAFPSGLVAMIRRDYGRVKIKIWKLTVRDYFLKFRV